MSTAILISGQLRTFSRCWPTQRWHVLRHFDDPHFFFTVQGNKEIYPDLMVDLEKEYGVDRIHYDPRTDPNFAISKEISAAYHLAPYANAAPAHQLLLQHYYQNEVWKFFQSASRQDRQGREEESEPLRPLRPLRETQFDTIIRLRADLWFHSFDKPEMLEFFNAPGDNQCFTPWFARFGGINDRFAIMGAEAARYYFTVFDHIPELLAAGCPFHPESLVKAALERGNVDLHETLRTEFTTFRADGNHRPPEIAPWDIAHAALRNAA